MDGLRGFHHAALTVTDVEASARWYRDVLGLDPATIGLDHLAFSVGSRVALALFWDR